MKRTLKWCGFLIMALSAGGAVWSLAGYAFVGFPFGGGAEWIAEQRTRSLVHLAVCLGFLLSGAGILVVGWLMIADDKCPKKTELENPQS
jgi:hypothetical protein